MASMGDDILGEELELVAEPPTADAGLSRVAAMLAIPLPVEEEITDCIGCGSKDRFCGCSELKKRRAYVERLNQQQQAAPMLPSESAR